MNIVINGKDAVLKKGSSFEFICENRFFTGADSYTLSITFPLAGCPQNIAIFGYINRKDCNLDTLLLDCEIHHKDFHRYGSVSIVDISETEVKTQFLEGRSAQNYHSDLDEIYINELEGLPELVADSFLDVAYYLRSYQQQREEGAVEPRKYLGMVFLPWVNNSSGNIQNRMTRTDTGFHYIQTNQPVIVGQPFLLEVIRQVLNAVGYECDLTPLENSKWANIIVCNALPGVWEMHNMKSILPHWTVAEFLEQVEMFLQGEFIFHKDIGSFSFAFNDSQLHNLGKVELESVIDSHAVEITKKEDVKNSFVNQRNVAYAEADHQMAGFYACDFIRKQANVIEFITLERFLNLIQPYLICRGPYKDVVYRSVLRVAEIDTCFVLKCTNTAKDGDTIIHYMRIQPVNVFGPRIMDEREDAEKTEIKIVPACIDHTDWARGDMIFIECGELNDDSGEDEDDEDLQTQIVNMINSGEQNNNQEFFDKLYVSFYDGDYMRYYPQFPRPYNDRYEIDDENRVCQAQSYDMRLAKELSQREEHEMLRVIADKKYTFTFIADTIPDVRSIFFIHGKRYLAEKITAKLSEEGVSQELKMVAYRIDEF